MGERRMAAPGDGVARVTVISLGGTIASAPAPGGTVASPRLSANDLVAAVPDLAGVAAVAVRDLLRLPSCDLTLDHALAVAAEVRAAAAAGADGVVVTQCTDTIEEMSFCLDLLVPDEIALAVTGAMRHAGATGSDGPANLLDAVRTVASPGYLLRHDSPRPSRRLQRPRLLTVSGPSRLEAETPLLDRFSQPRRPSRTRRRKMRPIRSLLQST